MMKAFLKLSLVAVALAATVSSPVYAWHGGHGGGYGHGRGYGWGGVAFGAAVIGSAAYMSSYPYGYGYPYSYSYPAYPYVAPAPVYAQPTYYVQPQAQPQYAPPPQQAIAAPEPASNMWYYCRKTKSYYPYARNCAAGWERVPATPPVE